MKEYSFIVMCALRTKRGMKFIMEIILATNNKNKIKEISTKLQQFGIKIISPKEAGCDIDVEETSKTLKGNAELKAEAVYKMLGKPVIADDSGLEIDVLNGEPRSIYQKICRI